MSNCFQRAVIFIDGTPHRPQGQQYLSGFELKQLAGLAPGVQLFLRCPSLHQDRPVGDMEALEMKDGLDFYGLPPGLLPEGWNRWDGQVRGPGSGEEEEPDGLLAGKP